MSEYKTSDFEKALQKKGFKCTNSHHKMFRFYNNGKMTDIITYISHGELRFGETILSLRKRQMKLTEKKQILDFIDCKFTEDDYRKWLSNSHDG
jgi:hypothetical protein